MKVTRLSQLLSFLLPIVLCSAAVAGQETHGGNGTILEFVKIGQNIKSQLERHPEWKISQVVNPERLSWSINNTFVNAGDSTVEGVPHVDGYPFSKKIIFKSDQLDAYDSDGNIYIHLALWNKLEGAKKVIEVLHLYLMQFNYGSSSSQKFDDTSYKISSLLSNGLTPEEVCSRFFSDKSSQKSQLLEGLSLNDQVQTLTNDIVKFLENHRWDLAGEAMKDVVGPNFKAALRSYGQMQVVPKPRGASLWLTDKDVITSADDFDHKWEEGRPFIYLLPNQSLKTRRREIQLASNISIVPFTPTRVSIWIDEKKWTTFTYEQKFELIFHEYLNLFSTLDLYYRVSSTLFLK